jgi:hypothetical protein
MAFKALSISITTKTEKKAAIEARVEAAAEAAWVKKETEDKEVRTQFIPLSSVETSRWSGSKKP